MHRPEGGNHLISPSWLIAERALAWFGRFGPLLRVVAEYIAAHMGVRLLAAVSGLMLIRLLSVDEYGLYTLLLAGFSFICTFSDLGATESLGFFRRRTVKRPKSWAEYLRAVLWFRRVVFWAGLVLSSAYIAYTGHQIGAGVPSIVAGVPLMGLAAWFAIQASVLGYVLKLEQQFRRAYALDLGNETVKLAIVCLIWLLGLAFALAGLVSIALGALTASLLAYRLCTPSVDGGRLHPPRQARRTRRLLLAQITPILPGTLLFSLQGPLVGWLAAYYGSIVNVAQVGALSRVALLIGVLAGFTSSVFVPRLLAIHDEALFLRRYLGWWLVILTFGGCIMLALWTFPGTLLWLLGPAYAQLRVELVLSAATAIVTSWCAFSFNVNRARGWVRYQHYRVPVVVVAQLFMLLGVDFSTTRGVLLFSLVTIGVDTISQTLIGVLGFYSSAAQKPAIRDV